MAAMTAPPFIDTAAVAARLGVSVENFLRARTRLEDEAGFPLPMPVWRRPMRWRAEMVDGWISAQGRPADQMPRPEGPNIILFEKARQA